MADSGFHDTKVGKCFVVNDHLNTFGESNYIDSHQANLLPAFQEFQHCHHQKARFTGSIHQSATSNQLTVDVSFLLLRIPFGLDGGE